MRRYLRKGKRMAEHNYVDDPDAPSSPFPPRQHALEAHPKHPLPTVSASQGTISTLNAYKNRGTEKVNSAMLKVYIHV